MRNPLKVTHAAFGGNSVSRASIPIASPPRRSASGLIKNLFLLPDWE
ncbi:MAG: hypothetical protein IJW00_07500 [Clostridia bacterium]|nr:hypothetical protein [Clostridia bacterium]